MKKLLIPLLVTLAATALLAQSTENLFWTGRFKVKMDKKAEWEKKIVLHLKTHYPTLKFRVYETLTGANTGSYVIAMGPTSYKAWDTPQPSPKGDAARQADAQTLDALCDAVEISYAKRQDDISNLNPDRKIKFLQIGIHEIELGTWVDVKAFLVKIQGARKKGGSKIDVTFFRPSNSGIVNAFTSVRYFEKWEELDTDENLAALYDAAHGKDSYTKDTQANGERIKSLSYEIRVLRPDLSVL